MERKENKRVRKFKLRCNKIISIAVIISVLVSINGISAEASQKGGWSKHRSGDKTVCSELEIDGYEYYKWLVNHDGVLNNDIDNSVDYTNYYIGTPYVGWDHRNPKGDCKGAYGVRDLNGYAAMNCTGFVWHVLMKSAVNSGKTLEWANKNIPVMGDSYNGRYTNGLMWVYNWLPNHTDVEYYYYGNDKYNSVLGASNAAVRDGVLEYGDIIFLSTTYDAHVGIYVGDGTNNRWWDSSGDNGTGNVWGDEVNFIYGSFKYLYVIKGGAKDVSGDSSTDDSLPDDDSSDESLTDMPSIGILGDLDGDGKITSADSLFILQLSVGLEEVTELRRSLADVDYNDEVTSGDSLYVLRKSVGINDSKDIGKPIYK